MKRKLFTLATIVICLSILAGGTFANFTAEGTAHNVITSGKVDVELREWADDGMEKPFPDKPVPVMPGTEQTKIVQVENVGTASAYVRVLVEKKFDGEPGFVGDTDLIGIDFDTTNWTANTESDGKTYYYYKEALAGGATTAPLFKKVTFNGPDMGNEYQNRKAYVNVYVMAVQAANNPVPDGGTVADDVQGWPELPQQ
ncbi:MAG: hypothetical protein IJB47_07840 [Oscillospiraceae bacterium]|nr:hypothetical protein [Oscillospiraceae bacterium]